MNEWLVFWTIWAIIAVASFAIITAVVAVMGAADIRRMLRGLASKDRRE